jgi:hypothetical protein
MQIAAWVVITNCGEAHQRPRRRDRRVTANDSTEVRGARIATTMPHSRESG